MQFKLQIELFFLHSSFEISSLTTLCTLRAKRMKSPNVNVEWNVQLTDPHLGLVVLSHTETHQ